MRTNIFKTSVILFSLFSLTACSKPSNQSSNQVEASSATVVEESAASETIHPVSEPMENQKVKSEDATKQALASYKKEKEHFDKSDNMPSCFRYSSSDTSCQSHPPWVS